LGDSSFLVKHTLSMRKHKMEKRKSCLQDPVELEVPLKENVPEISIAELLFNSLKLKAEEV